MYRTREEQILAELREKARQNQQDARLAKAIAGTTTRNPIDRHNETQRIRRMLDAGRGRLG